MKIVVTIKDDDLDKSVDDVLRIGSLLEEKFEGFKIGRCRCLNDGTSMTLED